MEIKIFDLLNVRPSGGAIKRIRFLCRVAVVYTFVTALCPKVSAQTCKVLISFPATPPKSGAFAQLRAAPDYEYYSVQGSRIYDTYDTTGAGPYIQIDTNLSFWKFSKVTIPGPMNRCAVWAVGNPLKLGFSVCVKIPESKTYYMGFGADNSGILTIDGDTVLQNMSFIYWGIYKHTFTKGEHLIDFSNVNFGGPAAIGFEIYDNTPAQIAAANSYGALNVVYSSHQLIGTQVEESDPDSSYSCPLGSILEYCAPGPPLCSQFVPITLNLNTPAPACLTAGVDLTDPAITAGNPTSLTYTYWTDSLATIPLPNPQKVTQSGTYYIEGTFNQCNLIKPVTVVVNSASTIIAKTLCPGQSYLGHTQTGSYTDTLKSFNGCDSLVTVNLTVTPKVNLGPDRIMCLGDTILLSPGVYSQYQWQDNSTAPQYMAVRPGTYWVKVLDTAGCESADTVVISPGNCLSGKIPNTFTPNGDGVNDTWIIKGLQSYPQCTVLIYNRWGQQVFSSIGYAKPWDGEYGGKPVPFGVYYYVINLTGSGPPLSGFVTVIR
jgi:gliding motility-associated-like protein